MANLSYGAAGTTVYYITRVKYLGGGGGGGNPKLRGSPPSPSPFVSPWPAALLGEVEVRGYMKNTVWLVQLVDAMR